MTDLCDEDAAEQSCKSSIARAEEASPVNPEAKQTKARFLIVKEQFNVSCLARLLIRTQAIKETDFMIERMFQRNCQDWLHG